MKEVITCGALPNVLMQSRLLEWAGISFGEQETYLIGKSIAVFLFYIYNLWVNDYLNKIKRN